MEPSEPEGQERPADPERPGEEVEDAVRPPTPEGGELPTEDEEDEARRAPPTPEEPALIKGSPVPPESVTPLVHLYRAEVARGDIWRQRMDATTNWAIGTATALVSIAFSRPDIPHVLIPLGGVIVLLLLCIEGRRYRFYDVWRGRTRLLEAHFFVPFILHEHALLPGGWRAHLAEDLLLPSYKMSFWRATGSRLRRNYIWIFLILLLCWLVRVPVQVSHTEAALVLVPGEVHTWGDLYRAFGYGPIPAWAMLTLSVLFYAGLGFWMWQTGRSADPDALVYTRRTKADSNPWHI